MNTVKINNIHYNADTLTDTAKALLSDVQKVQDRMNQISLDNSIMDLAKQTLIGKLLEETVKLEVVQVVEPSTPVEETAQA